MVYRIENSIKTYYIEDYFNPINFEKVDLVQVVIVMFSND